MARKRNPICVDLELWRHQGPGSETELIERVQGSWKVWEKHSEEVKEITRRLITEFNSAAENHDSNFTVTHCRVSFREKREKIDE